MQCTVILFDNDRGCVSMRFTNKKLDGAWTNVDHGGPSLSHLNETGIGLSLLGTHLHANLVEFTS